MGGKESQVAFGKASLRREGWHSERKTGWAATGGLDRARKKERVDSAIGTPHGTYSVFAMRLVASPDGC